MGPIYSAFAARGIVPPQPYGRGPLPPDPAGAHRPVLTWLGRNILRPELIEVDQLAALLGELFPTLEETDRTRIARSFLDEWDERHVAQDPFGKTDPYYRPEAPSPGPRPEPQYRPPAPLGGVAKRAGTLVILFLLLLLLGATFWAVA